MSQWTQIRYLNQLDFGAGLKQTKIACAEIKRSNSVGMSALIYSKQVLAFCFLAIGFVFSTPVLAKTQCENRNIDLGKSIGFTESQAYQQSRENWYFFNLLERAKRQYEYNSAQTDVDSIEMTLVRHHCSDWSGYAVYQNSEWQNIEYPLLKVGQPTVITVKMKHIRSLGDIQSMGLYTLGVFVKSLKIKLVDGQYESYSFEDDQVSDDDQGSVVGDEGSGSDTASSADEDTADDEDSDE